MPNKFYFFTLGYLSALLFGHIHQWRTMRGLYQFQKRLKSPHHKAEVKIDRFLYELENKK